METQTEEKMTEVVRLEQGVERKLLKSCQLSANCTGNRCFYFRRHPTDQTIEMKNFNLSGFRVGNKETKQNNAETISVFKNVDVKERAICTAVW